MCAPRLQPCLARTSIDFHSYFLFLSIQCGILNNKALFVSFASEKENSSILRPSGNFTIKILFPLLFTRFLGYEFSHNFPFKLRVYSLQKPMNFNSNFYFSVFEIELKAKIENGKRFKSFYVSFLLRRRFLKQ